MTDIVNWYQTYCWKEIRGKPVFIEYVGGRKYHDIDRTKKIELKKKGYCKNKECYYYKHPVFYS